MKERKPRLGTIYYDRDTGQFIGLTAATRAVFATTYKRVPIEMELIKMKSWLTSEEGRDCEGDIRFIRKWLKRAADKLPNKINERD